MARPPKFSDRCTVSCYMDRKIRDLLTIVAKARGMGLSQYLLYAALEEATRDRWVEQLFEDPKVMKERKHAALAELSALRQRNEKGS